MERIPLHSSEDESGPRSITRVTHEYRIVTDRDLDTVSAAVRTGRRLTPDQLGVVGAIQVIGLSSGAGRELQPTIGN